MPEAATFTTASKAPETRPLLAVMKISACGQGIVLKARTFWSWLFQAKGVRLRGRHTNTIAASAVITHTIAGPEGQSDIDDTTKPSP